jgi:lipopolysaccharide transport system permease protein
LKKKIFLFSELLRRDLTARYAGSFGGPLWALLNPLILCALYEFVFAVVLRLQAPAGFAGTYAEFLLAGLLPWIGLSEAISRGTTAVTDQAHLVKKMQFPIELLVFSALGSAFVLELSGLVLLGGFVAVTGRGSIHPGLLLLAFAFEALILSGPVLILSALNVFFRDLAQLVFPFLTIVFYLTPILYPESLVPARFAWTMAFNPLRHLVSLFRAALFGGPVPALSSLAVWAALFLVIAYAGAKFFRRCRPGFADLL